MSRMGLLRLGDSVVDAVEAAVRVLENDLQFDSGSGSYLTALTTYSMLAFVQAERWDQ